MDFQLVLAEEFKLNTQHVKNIMDLIDEGNTIPFIARYRKELTGSCDDQVLRELSDRLTYLKNLEKRKEDITSSITEQDKMTDELMEQITAASTLTEVEDLYRPYKQKRRTRATIAKEKGLLPLAEILFGQDVHTGTLEDLAKPFVNPEMEVLDVQAAIDGAKDIIAEMLSDDAELRKKIREELRGTALMTTKTTTEEDTVYRQYYDYSELISKVPSHRILAMNRGEKDGILKVSVTVDTERILHILDYYAVRGTSVSTETILDATKDAWQRLIFPSIEREIRSELTEKASEQAIKMFGVNLKPLLMQPPLNGKVVMGFDPAYRTGCKIAVVDPTGRVLDHTVVYPTPPNSRPEEAKTKLKSMISQHGVEAIAIGNGTASKESEIFISKLLKEIPQKVYYVMVNEAGASVYSASKLAALEFPEFDVSIRSAISIARRLQDPLAELVKIDPKAIGVGQYQHDMPVAKLDDTLTGVVEDCVNSVGVDVNTASAPLLSYISGLTAATSKNICLYREENGPFTARTQLKKVAKLGPKAFEQSAGFLRIRGGIRVLDNTAVHPESYPAVKALLKLFGYEEADIQKGILPIVEKQMKDYGEAKAAEACGVGVPTLLDIVSELAKPGRDIRDSLPKPILRDDVMDINDLRPGMEFMGTIRNVIDFGAFVDIGVHQDGLVHISQMVDKYIKHPSEVVKVGDVVKVWILEVQPERKRISLTMKGYVAPEKSE